MKRVRELKDLKFDEISLVDKGANQHASVVISKRLEDEPVTKEEGNMDFYDAEGNLVDVDALEEGDRAFDEDGNEYVKQYDEDFDEFGETVEKAAALDEKSYVKGATTMGGGLGSIGSALHSSSRAPKGKKANAGFSQFGRTLGGGVAGSVAGGAAGGAAGALLSRGNPVGTAIGAYGGSLGGSVAGSAYGARLGAENNLKRGRVQFVEKSFTDEIREELSKAFSDEERDVVLSKAFGRVEELEEVAKSAQIQAEQERYIRLENEYTDVAKNFNVGVDPEVLGPVLMRMAEYMHEDDVAVIAKALGTASEVMDEYMDELGMSGNGIPAGTLGEVDAYIGQNISKANMSYAEMSTDVFAENPDLYENYLMENGR